MLDATTLFDGIYISLTPSNPTSKLSSGYQLCFKNVNQQWNARQSVGNLLKKYILNIHEDILQYLSIIFQPEESSRFSLKNERWAGR